MLLIRLGTDTLITESFRILFGCFAVVSLRNFTLFTLENVVSIRMNVDFVTYESYSNIIET